MLQSFQRPARKAPLGKDRFEDEARFLRSWLERPLVTGAVTPSGKLLARTMASYVDPRVPGPVIELGPGTGPVTEALVRRGIAQDRLVLVEYNPEFCKLLKRTLPEAPRSCRATPTTSARALGEASRRAGRRHRVEPAAVHQAARAAPRAALRGAGRHASGRALHPVHLRGGAADPDPVAASTRRSGSNRVWLNLPPARVWVYRKR